MPNVLSRPPIARKCRPSFSIPDQIKIPLAELSAKTGFSQSELVRQALSKFLKEHQQ